MKKNRCLIVSIDAPPRVGGISNFGHNIANTISQECDACFFFGPDVESYNSEDIKYIRISDEENSEKNYIKSKLYEDKRIEKKIEDICISGRINRILLLHHHYYGIGSIRTAKRLGIPCELIVHGTEISSQFRECIENNNGFGSKYVNSRAFHLYSCLKKVDKVHYNSNYTKLIADRIYEKECFSVCGCGVDLNLYEEFEMISESILFEKKERRRVRGFDDGKVHICYVGRMVQHKRVERLFWLVDKLDCHIHLVGTGPGEAALKASVGQLGTSDSVTFYGSVPDREKNQIVRMCDFLALPSEIDLETGGYEGFGIVALEAIALGTVPILSGHQGLDDLLNVYRVGVRGLSSISEIQKTVDIIRGLKKSNSSYRSLLLESRQKVRRELTWSKVLERMWC